MRTLPLLLVMVSLLASSVNAVAHVDGTSPASSASTAQDHDSAPRGDGDHGAQKHCDLCGHGFGHLALPPPVTAASSGRTVPLALEPAAPPPTARPDRRDRPPK